MREIRVGENVRLGKGNPLVLIAGPCVIESEKLTLRTAEKVKSISERLEIPLSSSRPTARTIVHRLAPTKGRGW